MRAFLRQAGWQPRDTADMSRDYEYTDWNAVARFADAFAAALRAKA